MPQQSVYHASRPFHHGVLKKNSSHSQNLKMSLRGVLPCTERRTVCRSSLPLNGKNWLFGDCFGRKTCPRNDIVILSSILENAMPFHWFLKVSK
jgi:hypothetical protein